MCKCVTRDWAGNVLGVREGSVSVLGVRGDVNVFRVGKDV